MNLLLNLLFVCAVFLFSVTSVCAQTASPSPTPATQYSNEFTTENQT